MTKERGSTALVTGGSFGLGLAMARHLIAEGFHVIACGRSLERLKSAGESLPGLHTVRADVTRADDLERLFEEVLASSHPLDMLVNNAALSVVHDYANPFTLATDRARLEIETNFAAPIELIRRFLLLRHEQRWEEREATIVNISTPGALIPLVANPLYVSTKAGLHHFTLSLRRQLAETPVRVVEVFPPALDTGLAPDMNIPGLSEQGPEVIDEVARRSVEGIVAGEPTILPHPQSVALVEAVGGHGEELADRVNPTLSRKEGWDRE
jgi:uncharacterized oxidoreductase